MMQLILFVLFISSIHGTTLTSRPAPSWRRFFGVNTHLYNYAIEENEADTIANTLISLGVGAIRDNHDYCGNSAQCDSEGLSSFQKMANAGIKMNALASFWHVDGSDGVDNGINSQVIGWQNFQRDTGGMLQSIEGFNEINNSPFSYPGGMIQGMKDLYSAVKASSTIGGLPVYDSTDVCDYYNDGSNCNTISGRADYANIHPYPNYGDQTLGSSAGNINQNFLSNDYPNSGYTPSMTVITETGYHTDSYTNGYTTSVSNLAQGKLIVNTMLNAMWLGYHQAFIYELLDESDKLSSIEGHFGLFDQNFNAKPSGSALTYFSQLLADSGAGGTASVTFPTWNVPSSVYYMMFQNTAGTYFLVFWVNAQVWNGGDVTNNPSIAVSFSLPQAATIKTYNIYNANAAISASITSTSISFNIVDTAIVVSFSYSGTPPTNGPTHAPSPSGTYTTVANTLIYDNHGESWSFNSNAQVVKNGVADTQTSSVIEIAYVNNVIWQYNSYGNWYSWTYSTSTWAGPTTTSPIPATAAPTAKPTARPTTKPTSAPTSAPSGSKSGTVVLAGTSNSFTDSQGKVWTITSGAQIAVNGVTDTQTSRVLLLAYVNSVIWQLNVWDTWYSKTSATASWSALTTTNPLTLRSTDPTVESIYIGTSTVDSINGGGVTYTIASSNGGQVEGGGVIDTRTGNVIQLAYVQGTLWQLNIPTYNDWYGTTNFNGGNGVWRGPSKVNPIGYAGCYPPESSYPKTIATSGATVTSCITSCYNNNYKFASLQGGGSCTCGNTYGTNGGASEGQCTTACTGSSQDICGGSSYKSVYAATSGLNGA